MLHVEDEQSDARLFAITLDLVAPHCWVFRVADAHAGVDDLEGRGRFSNRVGFPLPDIIVLDLHMPKVPGLELLEWCRRNPVSWEVPVVLLTGSHEMDQEIQQALESGASRTFLKPPDIEGLARVAREICEYAAACKWARESAHSMLASR
jgi:CheY-like chemotaxis protein